jgi:biotin operon repressor
VTLSDVLDGFPRLSLEPGTQLLPEDFQDVHYVYVDDGLVILRSPVPDSARRTITCHAGVGALIHPPSDGEMVVALTRAVLVPISPEGRDRLTRSPEAAGLLLEGLSETLHQKQDALAAIARLHHVDRVREKLIQLARDHGRVGREGIRLDFPLTHDLLGEMTGSARETVTRAIDELQRQGFVVRQGRSYSILVAPDELKVSSLTMRE